MQLIDGEINGPGLLLAFSLTICTTLSSSVFIILASSLPLLFLCVQVTDVTRPVCQVVSTSTNCPSSSSLCASAQWEFVANLTDGVNGTGIESITIRQGNGTLNTSTVAGASGENITVATYSASCCSQNVELIAVDKVGNVGTCVGQARESTTTAPVTTTAVNTTSTGGHTLSISHCLWITVAVSLFWK